MYTDLEETRKVQEERIEWFKRRRKALHGLTSPSKMSENKVNRPEDTVVSEMIKTVASREIVRQKILSRKFHGKSGGTKFLEDRETNVFTKNPDAKPKKRVRGYNAIALTAVMSKWYAWCVLLRLEKEEEPESWKQSHAGSIDGIICQHLLVMMTQHLQKQWWCHEDNDETQQRETSHNVLEPIWDIKTAFDVARPKHIAKIMQDHDVHGWIFHGWIIAALLREMAGFLERLAYFESVESTFPFARCIR